MIQRSNDTRISVFGFLGMGRPFQAWESSKRWISFFDVGEVPGGDERVRSDRVQSKKQGRKEPASGEKGTEGREGGLGLLSRILKR